MNQNFRSFFTSTFLKSKHLIDRSKVPKLVENELEEQFIKGSGPGGSNVNTNSNCVLLKHIPTGTVVKCHESRLLEMNRKIARELLIKKLDNLFNGEMSIENQLKAINEKKNYKEDNKKKRLRLVKEKWKESRTIK
ncbi:hypothetical protein O3M35_013356 [Rhynocoris fuscipes]|uniref:Prokaryotic-type class I peptide chain release factors domain-containing protein n=1 Tax=Rhynocoris fuscipes TaxID=488301 RepID=A0AAW1CEC5_9HEMI